MWARQTQGHVLTTEAQPGPESHIPAYGSWVSAGPPGWTGWWGGHFPCLPLCTPSDRRAPLVYIQRVCDAAMASARGAGALPSRAGEGRQVWVSAAQSPHLSGDLIPPGPCRHQRSSELVDKHSGSLERHERRR